ncbi:signal recognition particle 9 kDa protein-domain-containing protein [Daldinia caldariorum]|uniref:signal recognition particle 9 kDa protein-domain-containing protein n=1 Tax=Daldinia caldariorum TaxID=326644 RepID=UPI0020088F12|nr:signal recognition particle 9 kDa protein-domain-containing protein [Daldinia caldariorum]KAI1464698.1 signal recognition particle 9 kDa protein-domain-containing protein [Daldinia caldariorum]
MPYYATSQEWLHQSSLLLEAQPNTTRITTKYHISKPKPRRSKKSSSSTSAPSTETSTTAPAAPRGSLTLKTYDPRSGVCLKYRTTKAAEVSRLIQSLGRPLGARMAALPLPEAADEVMADAPLAQGSTPADEKAEDVVPAAAVAGTAGAGAKGQGQGQGQAQGQGQGQGQGGANTGGGGGGGKGKKKRGKK